jgi:hypothetical protein
VHLGIILVNGQLDAQFFFRVCLFRICTCFEHSYSSSGELIVSVRHLVYVILCRWPSGMQVWVPPKPAYQTVTSIEWHIPDIVLIQLILLMMSTWCPKHAQIWNKHIRKKICASSWSFTRIICSVFSIFFLEAVQFIKLLLQGLWNKSVANSGSKSIYIGYVVFEITRLTYEEDVA